MAVELFATPVAPGRSRFFTVAAPMPKPKPGAPRPALHKIPLNRLPAILAFV